MSGTHAHTSAAYFGLAYILKGALCVPSRIYMKGA